MPPNILTGFPQKTYDLDPTQRALTEQLLKEKGGVPTIQVEEPSKTTFKETEVQR